MQILKFTIPIALLLTGLIGCTSLNEAGTKKEITFSTAPRVVERKSDSDVATSLPDNPTLDDYLLFALKNSATLKASFLSYKSSLLKAPQVSTLPDPVLSYGYFFQQVETRVGPQQHKVGVMQPIPWFGKLSLKESIANHEARAALYSFLLKKNQLASQVVSAYFELAFLEQATQITEANLELLKRWEQVVTQRYRSQTGTQADLIKVQVELGKMEDKLQELSQLKQPLLSRFNALLNRRSDAPTEIDPKGLEGTSISPMQTSEVSQGNLEQKLPEHNPELLLLEALTKAKEAGIDLANKNFYPDFGIGADYIFVGDRDSAGSESGDDALVGMFSITLPLYRSKYKAALSQAETDKAAILQMKTAKFHELSAELAKTIFETTDSRRRIRLFRDTLIPKADESLESTYTAFEAGESTFLELLDTERSVLDFQLSLARAQADLQIASAKLRSLLGDYSKEDALTEGKGGIVK